MEELDYVSNYNYLEADFCRWFDDYFAKQITKAKYLHPNEENFLDVVKRVKFAALIGIAKSKGLFDEEDLDYKEGNFTVLNVKWMNEKESKFLNDLESSMKMSFFLLAGRSLYGAMSNGLFRATMSNCYIVGSPEDSRKGITDLTYKLFTLFSAGGGAGVNISTLRPRGALVGNSAKTSTGAPSFIKVLDAYATTVGANNRRAALMICLSDRHPDIEEFIKLKSNNTDVQGANLSVLFDNEFMQKVAYKENVPLVAEFNYTSNGEDHILKKNIYPLDLFKSFIEMNWNWAEPGAIFIDTVRNRHLLSGYGDEYYIPTCNPCAEYFGTAGNACNLGSINLLSIVKNAFKDKAEINYDKLESLVRTGVRALDAILDYGYEMQPLEENKEQLKLWRPIGLGVFGLADMFIALNERYGSSKSLSYISSVMEKIMKTALEESVELAKEYGPFENFNYDKIMKGKYFSDLLKSLGLFYDVDFMHKLKTYGLRNGSLVSIAPTGSLSFMCNQSGGIEPHFSLVFERTTHSLQGIKTIKVIPKAVVYFLRVRGYSINKFITDENFRKEIIAKYPCLVSAADIDYHQRLRLQAEMQKFVDNSISSTINVPNETTKEEIWDAYLYAWKSNLKGITLFRDGCDRFSIMMSDKSKRKEEDTEIKEAFVNEEPRDFEKNLGKYDIRNYVSYVSEDGKIVPLPNTVIPVKRKDVEDILPSITIVKHTSCVKNLYVTVTFLKEHPFELFVVTSDGCTSNIAALSRSLSLQLRSGGTVEEIVKEMRRCICNACSYKIRTEKGAKCSLSCAIAVIDALEEAINQRTELFAKQKNDNKNLMIDFSEKAEVPKETLNIVSESYAECPSCKQKTLLPGKCSKCFNCGYNSCND